MPKLVKCPICGRKNSIDNAICSNCGTTLGITIKEEVPNYPTKKIKEQGIENIFKDLNVDFKKSKQKFSSETLKPNDTNIFLFINLIFTSLFLQLLVEYKIIFILTFYPTLYCFSCYWVSKPKFEWQDFLFQFTLLLIAFFFSFYVIPKII